MPHTFALFANVWEIMEYPGSSRARVCETELNLQEHPLNQKKVEGGTRRPSLVPRGAAPLPLGDENIRRELEPGAQFSHLLHGQLPLSGEEHGNRALGSELGNQIALLKALMFHEEPHN